MKSLLLLALGLARTVVLGARIEAERIVVSVRPGSVNSLSHFRQPGSRPSRRS